MAIGAPVRARRAPAPARSPATQPRRPPLSVVGPRRRRTPPAQRRRRPVVLAVGAALASVLAAGAAHAYLVQGQVHLAQLQQELQSAQSEEQDLQVQVAQLEAPARVVSQGQHQGLTEPSQVTDLPLVPSSNASSRSNTGR